MLRTPLACLICVAPAVAQPAGEGLEGFLKRLSNTSQGALVVLGDAAYVKDFRELLYLQDPLVEMLLDAQVPGSEVTQALRARQGWSEDNRWAWIDPAGAVRVEGTGLPSAIALAERLWDAGWEDRGQRLEQHLASQPSAMNAWPELYRIRWRIAYRRMESRLLPKDPKTGLRGNRQPLSEAEDLHIWGPTAEALDQLFRQGTWALFALGRKGFPVDPAILPPEASHSPLMRAVCARHLSRVEKALVESPEDSTLIAWWTMAQIAGRPAADILPMLARLKASPAPRLDAGNPYAWALRGGMSRAFLQACRESGDWKGLQEALRESLAPLEEAGTLAKVRQERWKYGQGEARILLEALIRSGRPHEAEKLVRAWAAFGLQEAPVLGAGVAEACGAPELARSLKAVTPAEASDAPSALKKHIPWNGKRLLLVLGAGPVAEACQALTRSVEWPELEVSVVALSGVDAASVAGEFGRNEAPRWMLLTGTGVVKAEGTTPPTLEGLTRAMTTSGLTPLRVRLEDFLRSHPKHAEARWDLMRLDLARAERLMAPHLAAASPEPPLADAGNGVVYRVVKPLPRLKAPLTEEEDRRIWGTAAREIQSLFADSGWAALTHPWDLPTVAARSPLMRKAARQALEAMEEVLSRAPFSAAGLWRLWASYLMVAEPPDPLGFLTSLRPLPVMGVLPPSYALDPVIKACREKQQWTLLRDLLEQNRLRTWGRDGGMERPELFKGTWDTRIAPLVEAYLRLGDEAGAEAVVRQAHDRYGARTLPASAAAVALACGKTDLALRWSAWKEAR